MRRAAWALLMAVTAAGLVLLFVIPARTLIAEDRSLATTQAEISTLDRENAVLAARQRALSSPALIEEEAHSLYGLVMAGQRAYAILPPATTAPRPARAPVAPRHGHPWWAFWR